MDKIEERICKLFIKMGILTNDPYLKISSITTPVAKIQYAQRLRDPWNEPDLMSILLNKNYYLFTINISIIY